MDEVEIKTAGDLKTQLSRVLDRAQVGEGEKLEVLHSLGRGRPGGPSAAGVSTPGAKQTEDEAKAQREREAKQAQGQR